ncbi:MAG: GNAT family N-acetyltransferase, partial [bacterium]
VVAGNRVTSLRQNVAAEMSRRGLRCRCLRCREVGRVAQDDPDILTVPAELFDREYESAGGREHFLTYEDAERRAVFAFCRLRLPRRRKENHVAASDDSPSASGRTETDPTGDLPPPEIRGAALLRELHTYGHLVPISDRDKNSAQHRGYGRRLMAEAERLAREAGFSKMAVISGVGVRGYYRRLGYHRRGTYMLKSLPPLRPQDGQ